MHYAIQRHANIWPARSGISLAMIAQLLDVPIVVVTNTDESALQTNFTYGLDAAVNWSEFIAAIDLQCTKGATIIPNVWVHPELGEWSRSLVDSQIRFLVAIPLCDVDGWRVGSIAVLANSKTVARTGIPIRRLGELGREFIGLAA